MDYKKKYLPLIRGGWFSEKISSCLQKNREIQAKV